MKKLMKVLRNAVDVVLLAPVKLPAVLRIGVRYVGWLLGVADYVSNNPPPKKEAEQQKEEEQ